MLAKLVKDMTTRELLAGMAMQRMASDENLSLGVVAALATKYADALIAELAKPRDADGEQA